MPNTPHPLEKWLLNRPSIRRHVLNAFLEDNQLSEKERAALDAMGTSDNDIAEYRANQLAGQSMERNGFSRLTRDRFQDAGFSLVRLDDHRTPANVIAFPTPQQSAG